MTNIRFDESALEKIDAVIDYVMMNVDGDAARGARFRKIFGNVSRVKSRLWSAFNGTAQFDESPFALWLYALATSHEERIKVLARLEESTMHVNLLAELESELQDRPWYDDREFEECIDEYMDFGYEPYLYEQED